MTIAEWIGTAALLAAPYPLIGLLWSLTHTDGLAAVLLWPVLLFSDVCAG